MEWSREEVLKYVLAMEQLSFRTQRNLIRLTNAVKSTKRNIARARCAHCNQRMRPKTIKASSAATSATNPGSMPILTVEPVAMDVTTSSTPPMSRLVPDTLAETPSSSCTTPMPKLSPQPQPLDLNITNHTEHISEVQQTAPPTMGYMAKFLGMKKGNFGIDLNEDQCSLHLKVGYWLEDISTEPSSDLEKEMAAVASELVKTPMEIGISAKRERFFDTVVHEGEDDNINMDEFLAFCRNE